jgi:hypothetical protein
LANWFLYWLSLTTGNLAAKMPVASEFREAATAENAAVRIPGADSRSGFPVRIPDGISENAG